MSQKPMLITGGAGFVGRNVVRHVLKNKLTSKIWIVDNLFTGRHPDEWLPKDFKSEKTSEKVVEYHWGDFTICFVNGDVRDFFKDYLNSPFANYLPQFGDIIHLASIVGGRALIEGDPLLVATDLGIDAEMFLWAKEARPERILYASSSAAYPVQVQTKGAAVALQENLIEFGGNLGVPDLTYGWSKLTGEYLSRIAAQHYALHVTCIRPFSGYGEDQEPVYPVPAIAARAARREDPFVIWGSGDQGRDFVHIEDCVEFMFLAMERISDGSGVNIGSGVITTFKQLAQVFARLANYQPTIKPLTDKPAGVYSRYADMTLVMKILGWKPKISLEEGMSRVYHMARKRLEEEGGGK